MKMFLLPVLMFSFFSLFGCKVSYDKNIAPALEYGDGAWGGGGPTPGVYLNAKVCLEGAGAIPMTTNLNDNSILPYVTPYTLAEPWLHYSLGDLALNLVTYAAVPWVDWVLVEVYSYNSDFSYYSKVDSQSALLLPDGSLYSSTATQGLYFANLLPGNYYINIKHRNHLAIATQEAVSITTQNYSDLDPLVFDVDLSDPLTLLTGAAATVGGNQCLAAGDVNNDYTIDSTDLNAVNNQVDLIVTAAPDGTALNGYFSADVDFDNVITKDSLESSTDHLNIIANDGLTTIVHPNAPAPP